MISPLLSRKICGFVVTSICFLTGHCLALESNTNQASATPPAPAETASSLIDKANQDSASKNFDRAIDEINRAIELNPHDAASFELRGSIYIEKKLWDLATRDYTTANTLSPDSAYRYKLAEIKFLQRSYSDARYQFAALESDERLGDLATYKVFLCDQLGAHESIAATDLAAIQAAGNKKPSYYFASGWWDFTHAQRKEAGHFFAAGQKLFGESTANLYLSSLIEAQLIHLATASFVAKDGTEFKNANIFLESDGLRVAVKKEWKTLPIDQLPDDLSSFPDDIQDEIKRRRAIIATVVTPDVLLSFTTKSGKTYEKVRWKLEDTGLAVLSPDGWAIVPLDQLPSDQSSFPDDLRKQLADKRAATPKASDQVSFTTKAGKTYENVTARVSDGDLSVLTPDGWSTVPLAQLPVDLSSFPVGLRAQIVEARALIAANPAPARELTFTTKSGKYFENVRWKLEDDGLSVLTPDGWDLISFRQLPTDLSPFPSDVAQVVVRKRKAGAVSTSGDHFITFTTTQGKDYRQVRAVLADDGVSVLTEYGWLTVPFTQLPSDLSPFPADWKDRIQTERQAGASDPDESHVVIFTTRKGKHYDQVRVALESTGLRLLTPEGLIGVPFEDLPEDLSAFPGDLRKAIQEGEKRRAITKATDPNSP